MEINNWSMHFVHLCSPFFFTFLIQVVVRCPWSGQELKWSARTTPSSAEQGLALACWSRCFADVSWFPPKKRKWNHENRKSFFKYFFYLVENLWSTMLWVTRYWVFVSYTSILEVQDPWRNYTQPQKVATTCNTSFCRFCWQVPQVDHTTRNALGKDYINRCGRTIAFSEKTCKYRVAWAWCGDVWSQVSPLNRMGMYIYIYIYNKYLRKQLIPDWVCPAMYWNGAYFSHIFLVIWCQINQFQSNWVGVCWNIGYPEKIERLIIFFPGENWQLWWRAWHGRPHGKGRSAPAAGLHRRGNFGRNFGLKSFVDGGIH